MKVKGIFIILLMGLLINIAVAANIHETITITDTTPTTFTISINSPPNETLTDDNTPDFNFTVLGSESSYSCELFLNNTGYSTSERWFSNLDIILGLIDIGGNSKPTVYYKDSIWYLISGEWDGGFYGYQWNGTSWVENSSIVSGLIDVEYYSTPTVFQKDSIWYLISGDYDGGFHGYQWNGTSWVENSSIVSGLIDVGLYSAPTVFEKDSVLYLISGDVWMETFHGYQWNGTSWVENSSIVSGLIDVGSYPVLTTYERNSIWYLILGKWEGSFHGYQWNGTSWVENSSIVSGLIDVGLYSAPTVFEKDSVLYLISGEDEGIFYGYQRNVLNNTPTVITANHSITPDGTYNWYINCTADSITNQSEIREITIDATKPLVIINKPLSNGNYTTLNRTLNVTMTDTNPDSCWYSLDNWDTNTTFNYSAETYFTAGHDSNTLKIGCNDTFGAINSSESISFYVYNPPSFVSPTPADNWNSNGSNSFDVEINLNWSASECQFEWNYSTNTTMNLVNSTEFTYTKTETTNGNYSYQVWCKGANNYFSNSSIRNIIMSNTTSDVMPPNRYNIQPSGNPTYASTTSSVSISLNTNEQAVCAYSTIDSNFADMTNMSVTDATLHTQSITTSSGHDYLYYIRCQDLAGNPNTASESVQWSIAETTSPVGGGGGGIISGYYLMVIPDSIILQVPELGKYTRQLNATWTGLPEEIKITPSDNLKDILEVPENVSIFLGTIINLTFNVQDKFTKKLIGNINLEIKTDAGNLYTKDIPVEISINASYIIPDIGKAVCGDGKCTGSETYYTCPKDCPGENEARKIIGALIAVLVSLVIISQVVLPK